MDHYDELLRDYVRDLREAKQKAEHWWQGMLALETARLGERGAAEEALGARWLLGPVAHPYVIAVYRHYHLAVAALNQQLEAAAEAAEEPAAGEGWGEEDDGEGELVTLPPHALLIEDLEQIDGELGDFMAKFTSPCIALDAAGGLC